MNLVGDRLVLPIFDAFLKQSDKLVLCDGVTIFNLPDSYEKRLRVDPEMIARYESSLEHMQTAIAFSPEEINGLSRNWAAVLEVAEFSAMSLRLATGIPVDTPYWFDVIEA